MLAHRMNTEWLFCCPVPVAYAHRQRSVALRAKTGSRISTTQTALRAVIPLTPPAPSPPAKALGARGGQAVGGFS